MNTLHLTLKKKWFDMILSGEKTEEYRDIKPYYNLRLIGRDYDTVIFRNGYARDAPSITIELKAIRFGNINGYYNLHEEAWRSCLQRAKVIGNQYENPELLNYNND